MAMKMGRALPMALLLGLSSAALGQGYHRVRSVALPGPGKGDYLCLDPAARRLYVTHADGVQVLDADSLKLVGAVEGVPHAHGVLVLPALGKGYATSGEPGSVVVFDLKSLKRLGEIPSQPDTDVIVYDPASRRVFTFNGASHNATVIDPATDKVLKTLELGGEPEMAVADGQGALYGNLKSSAQVIRINSRTLKVELRWPVAPGDAPTGLALDAAGHRLFIGCRNKLLVVMDAADGRVVQSLPIGDHIDTTVFDPSTRTVLESCGDGSLSVVRQDAPDAYHVVENAATEAGAKTMARDPVSGRLFLSTAHGAGAESAFHLLVLGQ
jgi:DNA-binding beta-propeller fold protein YncE